MAIIPGNSLSKMPPQTLSLIVSSIWTSTKSSGSRPSPIRNESRAIGSAESPKFDGIGIDPMQAASSWPSTIGIKLMSMTTVDATIENLEDIFAAERGLIPLERTRSVFVLEAIVDPKAVFLSLPSRLTSQPGFEQSAPIRPTIQGRSCSMDVKELAGDGPVVFGHTVLTLLDFVVDSTSQTLIGNPAHGGVWTDEMYCHLSNSAPTGSPGPITEPIA